MQSLSGSGIHVSTPSIMQPFSPGSHVTVKLKTIIYVYTITFNKYSYLCVMNQLPTQIDTIYSLGHFWVLHSSESGCPSVTNPGHALPPCAGCTVMTGLRYLTPPPHVTLHSPNSLYSHSQYTEIIYQKNIKLESDKQHSV